MIREKSLTFSTCSVPILKGIEIVQQGIRNGLLVQYQNDNFQKAFNKK